MEGAGPPLSCHTGKVSEREASTAFWNYDILKSNGGGQKSCFHLSCVTVAWCEKNQDQLAYPLLLVEVSRGKYCKTPLISTYVFSGLATVQVLIFGGPYLLSGGMIRRGEKSSKEEVCSIW